MLQASKLKGHCCPNCAELISSDDESCVTCGADFTGPGSWRPVDCERDENLSVAPINLGFTRLQRRFGKGVALVACEVCALIASLARGGGIGVGSFLLLGAASSYSLGVAILAAPVCLVLGLVAIGKLNRSLARAFKASLSGYVA